MSVRHQSQHDAKLIADLSLMFFAFVLSLLLSVMASAQAPSPLQPAQQQTNPDASVKADKDIRVLEPGKPIERELGGGQSHSYQIALTLGQYLHLVVDQQGVDVVVALFDPDGKKLTEVDSPNGTQGPEPVYWIAETSGGYKLGVRSLEKDSAAGRYEVRIEDLRQSAPRDRNRIAAWRASLEAYQYMVNKTPSSQLKALEKFEEALKYWRETGDSRAEAKALLDIGGTQLTLAEYNKALDYFNGALVLSRKDGNKEGEVLSLDFLGQSYERMGEYQRALDSYDQELSLVRAIGDQQREANTLLTMSLVYYRLGNQQKASELFGRARVLKKKPDILSDKRLDSAQELVFEAGRLNKLGTADSTQRAIEKLKEALQIYRAIENPLVRSKAIMTLIQIGTFYDSLGDKLSALSHLNETAQLTREITDPYILPSLGIIALAYSKLGEEQKALDSLDRILRLQHDLGIGQSGIAHTLSEIAKVYSLFRDGQKSITY